MRIVITEEQHKVLVETRLRGYRRFLKDNIFSFLPDYVLHDLFRETGDMGFRDIIGKSKQEIIDYFKTGWGREIWDRWSVFKDSKPEKIVVGIDDLDDDLLEFLKSKFSGNNENFPDTPKKLEKYSEIMPSLGYGENEPILVVYDTNEKIVDIPGGTHRLWTAWKQNNFEPVLMKSYVGYKQ